VDATFNRSPRKSVRKGSRELQMLETTEGSSAQEGLHVTVQIYHDSQIGT
jgi:hypothetical protein